MGTTRCAQKEALTNSPGPKTCAVFLNEMKIDNLTIANVGGRFKNEYFLQLLKFFLVARSTLLPARRPVANVGIK